MTNRHTISYLSQRLSLEGARPKHRFGQNFLIDLNLIELIVRTSDLNKSDVVLEVGTGTGSLTSHMAVEAGQVVTVEVDRDMQKIALDELEEFANVRLLTLDALAGKHAISPDVLAAIDEARATIADSKFKLVANLPYNIATPLMANLLSLERPPVKMVVTIQLEMAERIVAKPSTKDYGALSIWIQSQADCKIVRKLSPSVFWPRPKVESAIVSIDLNTDRRSSIKNIPLFQEFVRKMFVHRRKRIASQIEVPKTHVVEDLPSFLSGRNISVDARAEELTVDDFIALSNYLA